MAKRLEDGFKFESRRGVAKYPWDEWLDGSVWELSRDEDYPGVKDATNFITTVKAAAKREGKRVRSATLDGGKRVVIQSFVDEEVAAEEGTEAPKPAPKAAAKKATSAKATGTKKAAAAAK